MDESMARKSLKAREQFIREFELPIDIVQDPYFSQRLITLDCIYGCKKLWDSFIADLVWFPSVEDYIIEFEKSRAAAVDAVRSRAAMIDEDLILDKLPFSTISLLSDMTPKIEPNKFTLEFKLIDGGYRVLHEMLPSAFPQKKWEDFLSSVTPLEHLKYSEAVRREALHTMRVIQLRTIIYEMIVEKINHVLVRYISDTKESLLFGFLNCLDANELDAMLMELPEVVRNSITYDFFVPQELGRNAQYGFLFDYFEKGDVKLMLADPIFANQIVLYLKRDYIMKSDLKFNYNGHLAAFAEPILNPITYYPSIFVK